MLGKATHESPLRIFDRLVAQPIWDRPLAQALTDHLWSEVAGRPDHRVAGAQRRQGDLERHQHAEQQRRRRGEHEPEREERLREIVEHREVRDGAPAEVTRHEPGERAVEDTLLDRPSYGRDLEHGVAEQLGVVVVDRRQHPGDRRLLDRVEPAGRPQIEEAEATVG